MKPITVLIADDDDTIRDGLLALLETQPDLLPIGEATDGLEAVRLAGELHPDVVLMDVGMPNLDGVEATRRIKQLFPQTHVVVLTVYATHLSEALAAGANRYLLKDSCPADLMQAIRECSWRNGESPPRAVLS
jgi:two-component system, NarL family, response regulator LiaR